jgi:carboxylesterase type B
VQDRRHVIVPAFQTDAVGKPEAIHAITKNVMQCAVADDAQFGLRQSLKKLVKCFEEYRMGFFRNKTPNRSKANDWAPTSRGGRSRLVLDHGNAIPNYTQFVSGQRMGDQKV